MKFLYQGSIVAGLVLVTDDNTIISIIGKIFLLIPFILIAEKLDL